MLLASWNSELADSESCALDGNGDEVASGCASPLLRSAAGVCSGAVDLFGSSRVDSAAANVLFSVVSSAVVPAGV